MLSCAVRGFVCGSGKIAGRLADGLPGSVQMNRFLSLVTTPA